MKAILYAYLVVVLVLSGCSSGKSTFERGNYYEAVLTAVNRLRRNNDHKKSIETLRQAYPMSVGFFEDRAKTSLSSSERFKWSEVVKSYTAINTMYDEIRRCPGALAVIPNPVNYFSKLQEAKQNAAEENYAAGVLALQAGNRESAKQAYGYFKIANDFVPGYKEVNSYLAAALDAATVKIVVEPIPVHSKSAGVSAQFFNDKISEFVHSAPISEFVRFYTRAEVQKLKVTPNHIVQLQFEDFTVGEIHKQEKETQFVKDSVVMGTYISPSTAANQADKNTQTTPRNSAGLIVAGGNPVVSTQKPGNNNAHSTSGVNNQNAQPDQEKAARELAEKQKAEQDAKDRALAEKVKAEKEAADRERMAKDAAEKAAREAADKAAHEAAEKERLAREAAENHRLAKEASDKAMSDKLALEKETAEKARIEREKTEKERIENERAAKEKAEKAKVEKESAEKMKAEKEHAEKELAEKAKADKEKAEKEQHDRDQAERALAARAQAEKAKADHERNEKENGGKPEMVKAKYVDPTIQSDDTLNITDPVVVCHVPPGNNTNSRTLRINRSALKAHLAHGDSEGECQSNHDNQKNSDAQQKGNGNDDQKSPAQDGKKNKSGKGSAKIEGRNAQSPFTLTHDAVVLASLHGDVHEVLRYLDLPVADADTNKVYGTVKATLYQYSKTTVSKGVLSFRIIDAKTGALLSVQKMPGEFVWKSEWATFNGDERALSAEHLQLTKQKEQPAPAPQQLFIEFTRPIYDQITGKLKEFYQGY